MFKTRLDNFGNNCGHFWNFENFSIFLKIFENSTPHGTLGIKFFRKNHPKTRSEYFWEHFWAFLEFRNIFFENFRRLDIPWKTGRKFFKKNSPKQVQNTFGYFGNDFGQFWNFENFLIFLRFSKTRHSMENWAKIFQKKFPKTCSKHVWILLGTIVGIFGILKIFRVF